MAKYSKRDALGDALGDLLADMPDDPEFIRALMGLLPALRDFYEDAARDKETDQ